MHRRLFLSGFVGWGMFRVWGTSTEQIQSLEMMSVETENKTCGSTRYFKRIITSNKDPGYMCTVNHKNGGIFLPLTPNYPKSKSIVPHILVVLHHPSVRVKEGDILERACSSNQRRNGQAYIHGAP